MRPAALVLLLGLAGPTTLLADSSEVVVEQPWSRATILAARPGVAYMTIRNTGDDSVTLVGLRTEVAQKPTVHRSATGASGMARMEPAGDIAIPPGESVKLAPGGLHAMLMEMSRQLEEGTRFELTLVFGDGGEVPVEVPVLGPAARGPDG